jgi:TolA-binding protein
MPRIFDLLPAPLLLFLLLFVGAGCYTSKEEGQALRRDLDKLNKHLHEDVVQSRKERKELQKVMEQATALLTRNSADVGAQVDRLQARIDKLTGQVEEQQKKVNDLDQQLAKLSVQVDRLSSGAPPPNQPPIPADPNALFKLAQSKLAAGEQEEARRLLRHFRSNNPTDSRVDQAQLMLGDSYFAEQQFAKAIVEYKKILEQHKKSRIYPDALYKTGMAFYQLKFCSDAKVFLDQLIKRHRRYRQAARARKVLRLIRIHRRNPAVCR